MEKIWLRAYPHGVPAEINANAFKSLDDLFHHSVKEFADRAAFVSMGTTLTYKDLELLSGKFASYLQNVARLPRGTRVALMMPNLLQYPIAMFGILRAGCVAVNCNPLYTPRELLAENLPRREAMGEAGIERSRKFDAQEARAALRALRAEICEMA